MTFIKLTTSLDEEIFINTAMIVSLENAEKINGLTVINLLDGKKRIVKESKEVLAERLTQAISDNIINL